MKINFAVYEIGFQYQVYKRKSILMIYKSLIIKAPTLVESILIVFLLFSFTQKVKAGQVELKGAMTQEEIPFTVKFLADGKKQTYVIYKNDKGIAYSIPKGFVDEKFQSLKTLIIETTGEPDSLSLMAGVEQVGKSKRTYIKQKTFRTLEDFEKFDLLWQWRSEIKDGRILLLQLKLFSDSTTYSFVCAIIFEEWVMVPTLYHPQKAEIKASIVEMLNQKSNPFLTLEEPTSKKFVQFYNDEGRVRFDIPLTALSKKEGDRASKYFNNYEVSISYQESTDPNTGEKTRFRAWSATYPKIKIEDALNLAIGALYNIYRFSKDTRFRWIKSWQ